MVERARPFREGRVRSLAGGRFHDIAYVEWGDPAAEQVVLCLHGLTRQGRDFDPLAAELALRGRRIVCPDVAGRGRSGWLPAPELYGLPQYALDMTVLIARLGVEQVDLVGTSMGGLIGMTLAAVPGSPIRRLVLNDVGPFLPEAPLRAIGQAVVETPSRHASLEEAEARLRRIHAGFGPLTDAQWRHLAVHSFVEEQDGWRPHFDPTIGAIFQPDRISDIALWPLWDMIASPTLALRGALSDLLTPETAEEMTRRGPRAEVVEIAGCGHAPSLLAADQIAIVADWLDRAA